MFSNATIHNKQADSNCLVSHSHSEVDHEFEEQKSSLLFNLWL